MPKTPFVKIIKEKVDLRKKEQPLLDIKVTNPVAYIKTWWRRVMGREGIDFRFRIKPITAIGLAVVFSLVGFGTNKLSLHVVDIRKDRAMIGRLYYSNTAQKHYLITKDSTVISLTLPAYFDAGSFYKLDVLVEGKFSPNKNDLTVTTISPFTP